MYRIICLNFLTFEWINPTFGQASLNTNKLNINFSWKTIDFYYPTEATRQRALDEGSFVPGAARPIDIDLHYSNEANRRIFMTTPRFSDGVPTTIGYISNESSADGSALIKPYPNYEMNKIDGNCDHIISVYRVKVDECNRLWVVDTGIYKTVAICPPKLLLFNLMNDQLISKYTFDVGSIMNNTQLITPVIDIRNGQCDKAFVYLADVERYQLFVYDHANRKSWSIRNRHFYPDPDHGTFTINNLSFDLMDGLFGMALGPIMNNGDRMLYFHALASLKERFVATSVIRNSAKFEGNPAAEIDSFHEHSHTRVSQSASEAMNNNGILFYGSLSENSIKCWNSAVQFLSPHIGTIISDNQLIQFTAGLKIAVSATGREILLINSIAYQKMANDLLLPNETNFYFLGGFIDELIADTNCLHSHHHHHHHHH